MNIMRRNRKAPPKTLSLDLFTTDMPFNLSGETGTDWFKILKDRATREAQRQEEAKKQKDLFKQ